MHAGLRVLRGGSAELVVGGEGRAYDVCATEVRERLWDFGGAGPCGRCFRVPLFFLFFFLLKFSGKLFFFFFFSSDGGYEEGGREKWEG